MSAQTSFAEFLESTRGGESEAGRWPVALQPLWWDARGDWGRAHALAQTVENSDGAWVHAYLHRKEGDLSNAAYWYRRAGQPVVRGERSWAEEWRAMAEALLARSAP